MKLTLLKSKIHRATVTAASLHYEGSLTISADLAALVQLREYEKILVGNLRNGERFETYVIYGSPRKGSIQLNGATAHLGTIGDRITIMNFAHGNTARSKQVPDLKRIPRRWRSVERKPIGPDFVPLMNGSWQSGLETPSALRQWKLRLQLVPSVMGAARSAQSNPRKPQETSKFLKCRPWKA